MSNARINQSILDENPNERVSQNYHRTDGAELN